MESIRRGSHRQEQPAIRLRCKLAVWSTAAANCARQLLQRAALCQLKDVQSTVRSHVKRESHDYELRNRCREFVSLNERAHVVAMTLEIFVAPLLIRICYAGSIASATARRIRCVCCAQRIHSKQWCWPILPAPRRVKAQLPWRYRHGSKHALT